MAPSIKKQAPEKPLNTTESVLDKLTWKRAKSKLTTASDKIVNTINDSADRILQRISPVQKHDEKESIAKGWSEIHPMTLSRTSVHSLGEFWA